MASGDDQESSTTKKTTTRARSAKKQPAKKQTAKKQAAKKQAARKAPASGGAGESTAGTSGSGTSSASRRRASAPRAEGRPQPSAAEIGQLALSQLGSMTGSGVESITGLERTDDGWTVEVVAVELRRVPNTTDVLASYEVRLDSGGELQGYRRMERYSRGDTRSDQ